MEALILETTFLVDLEREALADDPGPAHTFLEEHPGAHLCITWITAGEVAAGPRMEERDAWQRLVRRFKRIEVDEEVAWAYGRIVHYLRQNGLLIGSNDLWIAACAVARELPLVTRNEAEYRRVPGLSVLGY